MREFTDQELARRDKLKMVKRPYPDKYEITHTITEARNLPDGTKNVAIAGRIGFMRKMGKLSFFKIKNIEDSIQLQFKEDVMGEEKYQEMKNIFDSGDFIGAKGEIITTQTGEKSLLVEDFTFLGKALRPLPEKFHGLQDTEIKYRERYVDLIMNQDSRDLFLGRSRFYYFLRTFMHDNKFLEVETPIVQTAVSGAAAKPFYTHHNALDIDCNLRIAPECYLKECNAAGFDRVYEVAKCFRNEGMDPQHLQEFTQIEWYASYWNFEDNIEFFQKFMRETCKYLKGSTEITIGDKTIDLGKEWQRVNYVDALTKELGFEFLDIEDPEVLREKIIATHKFSAQDLNECKSVAQLIDFCYKRLVRANIFEPTIMWNYPAVLKPLARRNDDNQNVVDVFQVIIAGAEICNAYSELVNPDIQRANFEDQLKQKAQGDDETMDLDEDYLNAMEQGMPPISGLGVGIDRLMMLLYNAASVRDVVLFPMMKPKN